VPDTGGAVMGGAWSEGTSCTCTSAPSPSVSPVSSSAAPPSLRTSQVVLPGSLQTPFNRAIRPPSSDRSLTQYAGEEALSAACSICATVAPAGAMTLHMRIVLPPDTCPPASITNVIGTGVPRATVGAGRTAGSPLAARGGGGAVNVPPASARTASCVAYRSSSSSPARRWKLPSGFCWAVRKSSGVLPCAVTQLLRSILQAFSPLTTQLVVSVFKPSDEEELTNPPVVGSWTPCR